MEEKNIALLGFISSASVYLKNQVNNDPEKLKKLSTINLDQVKEELSKKTSSIFEDPNISSKDLIEIGKQAFEDFINEKKPSLIDEFNEIFNVDFNEKKQEKHDEITAHLLELLSRPEELEVPVIKIVEKKEEVKPKIKPFIKEDPSIYVINRNININEILKNVKSIINEDAPLIVIEEQAPKFDTTLKIRSFIKEDPKAGVEDVVVDFDEVLKNIETIVENQVELVVVEEQAPKFDTTLKIRSFIKEDSKAGVEDVVVDFDEELKNIETIVENQVELIVVEEQAPKFDTSHNIDIVEEKTLDDVIETLEELSKQEEFLANQEVEDEFKQLNEDFIDSEEQANYQSAINDETVDEYVKIIAQNVSRSEEENIETIKEAQAEMDDLFIDIINHEDNRIDKHQPLSYELQNIKNSEYLYEPIFNPAYDAAIELEKKEAENKQVQENIESNEEENVDHKQVQEDVQAEEKQSDYVSELLDDFDNSKIADSIEENIKKEEEKNTNVFNQISRLYPYLTDSFIKTVYSLKEQISEEYSKHDSIVLLHRLNFDSVENLRRFIELVLQHDYFINADENKMIVDVFKKHKNVDGKILTDIFEIANQAKLLSGEYEGYRVIVEEDILEENV